MYLALLRGFAELFERSPVVYLASVAVKDMEVVVYLSRKRIKNSVKDHLEYIKTGLRELHCKTIEEFLEFTKACSALHYCRV